MGNNPYRNDSGCLDRTAGEAISHVSAEEKAIIKRQKDVILCIKLLLAIAGFKATNRIHLEHIETGRKYH